MARPRKTRAAKQSAKVLLHMTLAEKRRLEAAAAREGLPVATVARLYAMRIVDQSEARDA